LTSIDNRVIGLGPQDISLAGVYVEAITMPPIIGAALRHSPTIYSLPLFWPAQKYQWAVSV
jgi:hypothetical protein